MRVLPAERSDRPVPRVVRVTRRAPEANIEEAAASAPVTSGRALVLFHHGSFFERLPETAGAPAFAPYLAQAIGQMRAAEDRPVSPAGAAAAYERSDAMGGGAVILEFPGARLSA